MEADAPLQSAERLRCCPACGTPYSGATDSVGCPVCLCRRVLETEAEQGSANETSSPPDDGCFDHYEIVRRHDGSFDQLGRGAMGVTYRAIDTVLGHAVALKVIDARIADRADARERFLREARAAARLRHTHVASVFYYGVRKSDGQCFYAMELVEGETLETRLHREGPLPASFALEVVAQVARALAAAESQGLVHRDLKPANVMLMNGPDLTVKVIDFGLAKAMAGSESDITHGAFVGTPAFASPEQFTGNTVDVRSDLYSLGVMVWEMVTGHALFRGFPAEVMHQHQHASLPVEQLTEVPQPIAVLLEVLLEKDPTRRFQSPMDLLNCLPKVVKAIKEGRSITHQSLREIADQPLGVPGKANAILTNVRDIIAVQRVRLIRWAALALVISGGAILAVNIFIGPKGHAPQAFRSSPLAVTAQQKSIAVLPFESLSENKSDSYFADGVQDEILSCLAKVSQLRVISRTSVMTFRPGNYRDLRSIATGLDVAQVLEGTVRRDGTRVRITTELIDAESDRTLWSDSYDRDLTDIFAVQSEIAQTVVAKLKARLSPEEKRGMQEKPTENLEAYDLYLRAKELLLSAQAVIIVGNAWKPVREAITLLDEAIQLDPMFTLAYCASARAHDLLYLNYDLTPQRRALGDAAVNEALRLQSDRPEVHLAYASHLYYGYRDYEPAQAQLAIAMRGLPNNSEAMFLAAVINSRQGNWEKAIRELNEALTLDPRNTIGISELALSLFFTRRFREAEQAFKRAIDLAPEQQQPLLKIEKAFFAEFLRTADDSPFRSVIEALPKQLSDSDKILSWRLYLTLIRRDYQQAGQLIEKDEAWGG